jgi:hypothetical protein
MTGIQSARYQVPAGLVAVIVRFIGKAEKQRIEAILLAQTIAVAVRFQTLNCPAFVRGGPREAAGDGHSREVVQDVREPHPVVEGDGLWL